MRHRWYSPTLGQFVSHDPYEYVDSFNLYAFAAFDPINNWDPWGLSSCGFFDFSCQRDAREKEMLDFSKLSFGGEQGAKIAYGDNYPHIRLNDRIPAGSKPRTKNGKVVQWRFTPIIDGWGPWTFIFSPEGELIKEQLNDGQGLETPLLDPLDVITPGAVTAPGKAAAKVAIKGVQAARALNASKKATAAKAAAQQGGKKLGSCMGGSCTTACFVQGTLVWHANGEPIAIEALQVDQVVSVPLTEHPHQRASAYHADHCPVLTQEQVEVGTWLSLCQDRIVAVKSDKPEHWREVIGSAYAPGDLHKTDVTPLLWRRVELVLHQSTGAQAKLSVLRPLWWLKQLDVQVGAWLNLEIVEAGLVGQAQVLAVVDDVQHDSRALLDQQALVIGTIAHEQAQVLRLTFEGDQKDVLGITPTHPLYSASRQDWVQAQHLALGEVVTTQQGHIATLTAIEAADELLPVFNLEVHRAQSYYVGHARVLAHNTGFDCLPLGELGKKLRSGEIPLSDEVLFRIKKLGPKGRAYGTPANPSKPSLKEFNPRVYEIDVGKISIKSTKHGIDDMQSKSIQSLSNEQLLNFNIIDPISSNGVRGGLNVTGGHHRIAEIQRRIATGQMSINSTLRVLIHD